MDIQKSVERVHGSQEILGERFYRALLERHPEAKPFFREVHMRRQAVLLTMQLSIIENYYRSRSPAAAQYLQILGTRHHGLGIPREFYPPFRDVLVETLAEFLGDDWDENLARQWREAIDLAAEKMFEGYEQHFQV